MIFFGHRVGVLQLWLQMTSFFNFEQKISVCDVTSSGLLDFWVLLLLLSLLCPKV